MAGKETIFEVIESPEGGYEARALGESIFTQADSLQGLRDAVRDAVHCHWGDRMREMPAVIRLHFVHDEVISA